VNVLLNEEGFKKECQRWNVSEVIFDPNMWALYQPMLRADFHLFDKYDYAHIDKPNFEWSLTTFHATRDQMITREMVEGWETHTNGAFELLSIDGHHLFPLQKEQKRTWLEAIVARLEKLRLSER
jgi:surfactin synthase thioesterase subunit